MNLEDIIKQLSGNHPSPVVAYCNVIADDKIAVGIPMTNQNIDCNSCQLLRTTCLVNNLTCDSFKKKLKKDKELTCILFFDNYVLDDIDSEQQDEILLKFIKLVAEQKIYNVCLSSSRNHIADSFKKYLTQIKFGE